MQRSQSAPTVHSAASTRASSGAMPPCCAAHQSHPAPLPPPPPPPPRPPRRRRRPHPLPPPRRRCARCRLLSSPLARAAQLNTTPFGPASPHAFYCVQARAARSSPRAPPHSPPPCAYPTVGCDGLPTRLPPSRARGQPRAESGSEQGRRRRAAKKPRDDPPSRDEVAPYRYTVERRKNR